MVRIALLVLAGCGRLGFEPGTSSDAAADSAMQEPCAFDLCDGFEAATLDTSLWTVDPMVARDTSVAHRGSASVRMHTSSLAPNQRGDSALTQSRTFQSSPTTIWVRAWFRLSALPAGANVMDVIALEQTSSPFTGDYVFVSADQIATSTQLTGNYLGTMLVLPVDTWFCLVWHVRLSPTNAGIIELSGDLFDQLQLLNGTTDGNPPVSSLRLGINLAPPNVTTAQPPIDLWLDDVIIHSAPLTCAD